MPHVVVVSPPFHSHARPLTVVGAALRAQGARVTFACGAEFADLAAHSGLDFRELRVTPNANSGIAERSAQPEAEAARLREFLDSTRAGAVPALMTQTRHRRADMLAAPHAVRRALAVLAGELWPDWFLVDQLSYAVTLALHCLDLPFATFCPGHPSYIPRADGYFGAPYAWPRALRPTDAQLTDLIRAVAATDREFTAEFNRVITAVSPERPRVARAFGLASPHARLFNYPPLPGLPARPGDPRSVFAGHCAPPQELEPRWRRRLDALGAGPRVLVSFGTFLSARDDVLRACVEGVRASVPDARIVVAAGDRSAALADLAGPTVIVEPFVPQRALLDHVDLIVHHGGNNSFTEALRAGVPALVLPFSSDQFAIAHDAELAAVGACLDPNTASPDQIGRAAAALLRDPPPGVAPLRRLVADRGPEWAARRLLDLMERATWSARRTPLPDETTN